MIIVRIESGLGNQMLDFAEYLAVKKAFPNVSVYADLTIFDINQKVNLPISQWNGYELNSIFGIIQANDNINNTDLEKEFSEALLNIGANQKKKNNVKMNNRW